MLTASGRYTLKKSIHLRFALWAIAMATTVGVKAENAALQGLFFAACANPQANLAARCGETTSALGDLSSDSESSLNPSQGLGSYGGGRGAAEDLQATILERSQSGTTDKVERSAFSLIFNAYRGQSDYDQLVDIDSERGFERDEEALDVGFDYQINDRWLVGALAQFQAQDLTFANELPGNNFTPVGAAGDIQSDVVGVAIYISHNFGEAGYVDLSYIHTRTSYDISRNAIFQESTRTLDSVVVATLGKTDGSANAVNLSSGYTLRWGQWNVSPFASVSLVSGRIDDYAETDISNSGLAMSFDMQDNSTSLATLGVRLSRPLSFAGGVVVPSLRVQYTQPFSTDVAELSARFVNDLDGNSLSLTGSDLDDGYLDAALAANFVLRGGWMPFVEFQITEGIEDLERWRFAAGIRKEL